MKKIFLVMVFSGLLIIGCKPKPFHVVKVDNPVYVPDTTFISYEDLSSPKFAALKEKYQLDTIFHGEKDEFKRILLLRNWIRSHIRINDIGPYPGNGSAESILDNGLKGYGFHCGHFMTVQNAIMNAYGYVTRSLGAGPGGQGGYDFHHGINEIWLNSYHKWFLSDAKYNHHFEKNGIPLSALEIRDEYLKNKAADIKLVKGPNRIPMDFDTQYHKSKVYFASVYTNIEWFKQNDLYVHWPKNDSHMIMYNDDYFKHHTWIWDGKPHWAYNTPYMQLVKKRSAIDWTPNTIASKVKIEGNKAFVWLTSTTPNLKSYQLKDSEGNEWKNVADSVNINLTKDTNKFIFRVINTAGVTGPDHTVLIER